MANKKYPRSRNEQLIKAFRVLNKFLKTTMPYEDYKILLDLYEHQRNYMKIKKRESRERRKKAPTKGKKS